MESEVLSTSIDLTNDTKEKIKLSKNLSPMEKLQILNIQLAEVRKKKSELQKLDDGRLHSSRRDYSRKPVKSFHHPNLEYVYGEIVYSPYMTKVNDKYEPETFAVVKKLREYKKKGLRYKDLPDELKPYDLKATRNKFIHEVVNYNPGFSVKEKSTASDDSNKSPSILSISMSAIDPSFASGYKSNQLLMAEARGGPVKFKRKLKELVARKAASSSPLTDDRDRDVLISPNRSAFPSSSKSSPSKPSESTMNSSFPKPTDRPNSKRGDANQRENANERPQSRKQFDAQFTQPNEDYLDEFEDSQKEDYQIIDIHPDGNQQFSGSNEHPVHGVAIPSDDYENGNDDGDFEDEYDLIDSKSILPMTESLPPPIVDPTASEQIDEGGKGEPPTTQHPHHTTMEEIGETIRKSIHIAHEVILSMEKTLEHAIHSVNPHAHSDASEKDSILKEDAVPKHTETEKVTTMEVGMDYEGKISNSEMDKPDPVETFVLITYNNKISTPTSRTPLSHDNQQNLSSDHLKENALDDGRIEAVEYDKVEATRKVSSIPHADELRIPPPIESHVLEGNEYEKEINSTTHPIDSTVNIDKDHTETMDGFIHPVARPNLPEDHQPIVPENSQQEVSTSKSHGIEQKDENVIINEPVGHDQIDFKESRKSSMEVSTPLATKNEDWKGIDDSKQTGKLEDDSLMMHSFTISEDEVMATAKEHPPSLHPIDGNKEEKEVEEGEDEDYLNENFDE